jgi:hypothetical protein
MCREEKGELDSKKSEGIVWGEVEVDYIKEDIG